MSAHETNVLSLNTIDVPADFGAVFFPQKLLQLRIF
jgi:hypothetical protein